MVSNSYYEWGYRVEGHVDVWEVDHGDGSVYTPAIQDLRMPAVDLYDGREAEAIRRTLKAAGIDGRVIRRLVTIEFGNVEVLPEEPVRV